MERKTLTFLNEKGESEDLIPYVDDLAVKIGGTNLKDYLAQIEQTIEKSNLYLGAFVSETALLEKYPDGTALKVGTYAIVSDSDSLYIYDTDTLRWLKTASATLGIVQLNGLNPINGSLTITGGDIKSIVDGADVEEQTITEHLTNLYIKDKTLSNLAYGTILYDASWNVSPTVNDRSIVYTISLNETFKNTKFLAFKLKPFGGSEHYEKYVSLNITYSDGTTTTKYLYSSDGKLLTGRSLRAFLSVSDSINPILMVLIDGNSSYALNVNTTAKFNDITERYDISSSKWVQGDNGYTYTITATQTSAYKVNTYNVLSIYKEVGGKRTTAIVDYSISSNVITLYSDETFTGGVIIQYTAE